MLRTLFAVPAIIADTLVHAGPIIGASFVSVPAADPLIRSWARVVLLASGVTLTVDGLEHLDLSQRYIFVANHQSHMDVPSIVAALPLTVRFVAKQSLFKIPVFGQAIRAVGTIEIDRSNREDALKKMQEAQTGVARQASILFFAEGTRSEDCQLKPFKKGAFAMAAALGLPIVPIGVSGTNAVLPPGLHPIRGGPVRVRIGTPFAVGENTPEERRRLQRRAEEEVAKLLGVAPPSSGGDPDRP